MTATVIFLKKRGLVHADRPLEIIGYYRIYDHDNVFMEQEEALWRQK
jgi:hypothetical protein